MNHKDGNKENNNIENLEWVSWRENTQHAWRNGLCKAYDRNKPWNKSTHQDRTRCFRKYFFYQEDVDKIKQLREQGLSQQKIADMLDMKQGTISQILSGNLLPQKRLRSI